MPSIEVSLFGFGAVALFPKLLFIFADIIKIGMTFMIVEDYFASYLTVGVQWVYTPNV